MRRKWTIDNFEPYADPKARSKLGDWLGHHVGAVFGGYKLVKGDRVTAGRQWQAVKR